MDEVYAINNKLDINQNIIIFGTGKHAKQTFRELICLNLKIDYFADRNPDVVGLKLYGIEVIDEDVMDKDAMIIIASTEWKDIGERLKQKGYQHLFVDTKRYSTMKLDI